MLYFSTQELRNIDAHLCVAASIYRDDAAKIRNEQPAGWERLAEQFERQEKECREIMEKIGEHELAIIVGAA